MIYKDIFSKFFLIVLVSSEIFCLGIKWRQLWRSAIERILVVIAPLYIVCIALFRIHLVYNA